MPLNDRKIISIILEEAKNIQDRCPGYTEELVAVITDIVTAERQHRIAGTNIQQRVNDKCNGLGRLLADHRSGGPAANGDTP